MHTSITSHFLLQYRAEIHAMCRPDGPLCSNSLYLELVQMLSLEAADRGDDHTIRVWSLDEISV